MENIMPYRRAFVPGGSYFFTVVTERRRKIFSDDAHVDLLRLAFQQVMAKLPFKIDAAVILPDHLHCIWTLPPGEADFATRWRLIKTWFSKHCSPELKTPPSAAREKKKEQAIWQHRYWEHLLRNETDYQRHIDYIHCNPVKHGYVDRPSDWRSSSLHRYIEQGIIDKNWGIGRMDWGDDIGHE